MPWTHMDAWAEAVGSDKLYLIVRGDLVFDERDLPQTDWDNQSATPPMSRIDGFIGGQQLGRNGFRRPYEAEVLLEVSCYGPWCAGAVSDERYVAFIEMRDGELVVETNPCGGFLFPATEQIEEDLTACMRGDVCEMP